MLLKLIIFPQETENLKIANETVAIFHIIGYYNLETIYHRWVLSPNIPFVHTEYPFSKIVFRLYPGLELELFWQESIYKGEEKIDVVSKSTLLQVYRFETIKSYPLPKDFV